MTTVPYLTTAQYRLSTGGWDVDDIEDEELLDILLRASQVVDDYTNTTWSYQTVYDEMTPWKGLGKKMFTKQSPVRTVTSFRVLVGTQAFGSGIVTSTATIPTTPPGPPWLPATEIPYIWGYVVVNRPEDTIEISQTNWNMRLLGLPYINGLAAPKVLISYTAGYNPATNPDGTPYVAPDSYSLPYPTWLTSATRLIAGAIIGERNTNIENLGSVEQARQGDVEFRRARDLAGSSDNIQRIIPPEALAYLQRRRRTVLI